MSTKDKMAELVERIKAERAEILNKSSLAGKERGMEDAMGFDYEVFRGGRKNP